MPRINQLQSNIQWGQRGNYLSVPTDCPQRDERLGWMGDAQVFIRTATYNADVAAFFTKWLVDVDDGQSPAGAFSDVSPNTSRDVGGVPAWGDAGVICPWTIYRDVWRQAHSGTPSARHDQMGGLLHVAQRRLDSRPGPRRTTMATGCPSTRTRPRI